MNSREKGQIGEDVACLFLVKHGYSVVTRNYLKKCGELDIVAEKGGIIYFAEVKSVITSFPVPSNSNTFSNPLQNIDQRKAVRMKRAIRCYIAEHSYLADTEFQVIALAVYMNMEKRLAKVTLLPNIVL